MARTSRKRGKTTEQVEKSVMKIGFYVRLSNKDNGRKNTDSIDNQLELLVDFVKQFESKQFLCKNPSKIYEKIEVIKTYIDNGQTGTDFDRPGWKQMIEDAKRGKINCIIVKDLSRFARNYLEAGDYLEKIFPFLGVRFIAVNDYFDSAEELFQGKEWMTEFKNLVNDFYSKDISKKIRSAFQVKREQGQFIGSKAPYGYLLENNHLVIDEPAAEIVRRIFTMRIQGIRAYSIANILNQEGIPSPSRYAKEQGLKKYRNCGYVLWQQEAVSRILYNRVYIGDFVQRKNSIDSKERQKKRIEDEWEVRKGIHPAIIDWEIFQKVQSIREKNKKI